MSSCKKTEHTCSECHNKIGAVDAFQDCCGSRASSSTYTNAKRPTKSKMAAGVAGNVAAEGAAGGLGNFLSALC